MKITVIESFEMDWKLVLPAEKVGAIEFPGSHCEELKAIEKGVATLTFGDSGELEGFLKANGLFPEISLLRRPVPESAIISYILPTEWTTDNGYNRNWWRTKR